MKKITILSIILLLLAHPVFASTPPKDNIQQLRKVIHLGDVQMTGTTKNKLAQDHFILGIGFLHAFMYQLAIDQFKAAEKLDPGFAMAYWGEAMANKHPIWSYENTEAAREALARYGQYKDHRTLTDKENKYLHAAQLYFADKSLRERDESYTNFMRDFYARYPDDPNIGAFYTLALMGQAADFATDANSNQLLREGRKAIKKLAKRFPHHPGIVHYYLHYHDVGDKTLAKKAIPQSKTALTIMRSSSHVAHMAAHIFRRLERWDDFIDANRKSVAAADKLCKLLNNQPFYACNADNKYHSLEWLQYGYLKKKQYAKAAKVLARMRNVYDQDQSLPYTEWYYRMWARQVIATKGYDLPKVAIKPITNNDDQLYWAAYTECAGLLAKGLIELNQGKSTANTVSRLDEVVALSKQVTEPYIHQTCQLAKLRLQLDEAHAHKQSRLQRKLDKQYTALSKKRISTEVTPSLSILPGTI